MYFQAVVKNRRRRNKIIQVKNDREQWVTEAGDIEQCFQQHFHNLYAQPVNEAQDILEQLANLELSTLNEYQTQQLEMPILDEEITLAINQMEPSQNPRI
jgi:hypothetical protein